MKMKKVNTVNGYDFYKGFDEKNKREVYDIQQSEYKPPEGGYFTPGYILGVKGFKETDTYLFEPNKNLLKNKIGGLTNEQNQNRKRATF